MLKTFRKESFDTWKCLDRVQPESGTTELYCGLVFLLDAITKASHNEKLEAIEQVRMSLDEAEKLLKEGKN